MNDNEIIWENLCNSHELLRMPHHVAMLELLKLAEDGMLTQKEIGVVKHYCYRNIEVCKLVLEYI